MGRIPIGFMQSNNKRRDIKQQFGKRASAKKLKKINYDIYSVLHEILSKASSQYAQPAQYILLGSLYFGLRPSEWVDVEIVFREHDNKRFGLKVKNAKQTQERAHGSHRTIWFDKEKFYLEQPEEMTEALNWLLDFSDKQEFSAAEKRAFIERVSKYLSQLYSSRKELKKYKSHVTLYSARHQFAANLKRQGFTLEEIAALMGHASIETNIRSYGKARYGHSGVAIEADPEDLKRVQQLNAHRYSESVSLNNENSGFLQPK